MPKRKFEDSVPEGGVDSGDNSCSSQNTEGSTDVPSKPSTGGYNQLRKKQKKSVNFDGVTVYYFARKQGFTCVPSQGGSTLGMAEKHQACENYTLSEYTQLQRQLHHRVLLDQHEQGKIILPPDKLLPAGSKGSNASSAESSSSENGSEPASSDSEDEFNIDDYYFLQPVPTKQRRMLLRQSGVKKIEPLERDECKDIRSSREVCGCSCKVFCDPETCICSQAGIKCQVDRLSFPCGCSRDGCANRYGRIEFNPIRVRTHFIHTLMRLELEKKKKKKGEDGLRGILKPNPVCTEAPQKSLNASSCCPATRNDGNTDEEADREEAEEDGEKNEEGEEEEVNMYNSNEKGSCRDCQSSEITDIIMRESQFGMQNADPCIGPVSNHSFPDDVQLGLPTVTNAGESLPQVMLFSDDDETYHPENTTAMFAFPKDEASYSESSDCSSEGSTSGDDQLVYTGYQNYNYDVSPESSAAHTTNSQQSPEGSNNSDCSSGSGSNNNSVGIPEPHHNACNYEANGSSALTLDQKYLNGTNGYKLEPISEILGPIRFACYSPSENSTAGTTMTWNAEYCGSQTERSPLHNVERPPCPSGGITTDFVHQTGGAVIEDLVPPNGKGQHFFASDSCPVLSGENKNCPVSGSGRLSSYVSSPPQYMSTTEGMSLEGSRSMSNGTLATSPSDEPKYHELKASSQQSPEDSIASSFFSTANQVAASLDLTNQNSSAPMPSFHLSSSQSVVTKGVNDIGCSESSELYSLPPVQQAEPVASFDLPGSSREEQKPDDVGSFENKAQLTEMRSDNSPSEQSTQNFGEIIKESIVETVSA